jgi:hypothetical protein
MKKLLSMGLMSIAVLGLAVGSDAHEPPGELLVAVNFPDGSTPMIDGNSSDWSAVPLDQYGIFSETLFSIHGFAGENVDRGGLDASSMQIRHIIGWNDAANSLYFTSRVYDNIHVTQRVDAGRFYWDDSWEVEVNAQHQALDDLNPGDDATNFSYKFAFPVYLETFEWYRPNRNLPWLTSGSQWLDVAADYSGDEFGESTYDYELRVTPISSMPKSEEATEGQVNIHDLSEGEVVHVTITVNDVDGGDGDEDNRIGMWSTNPISCCHAGQDLLLTPIDPNIDWGAATAVEESSWAKIKAQF